jgi:hypothetical protein
MITVINRQLAASFLFPAWDLIALSARLLRHRRFTA